MLGALPVLVERIACSASVCLMSDPPLDPDIAKLSLDIRDDAIIGGRRRAEDRNVIGHPLQHIDQATVVGAKVMAPIGYAVGLVDHQQTNRLGDRQRDVLHELVVGQAFRRNQQGVNFSWPGPPAEVPATRPCWWSLWSGHGCQGGQRLRSGCASKPGAETR